MQNIDLQKMTQRNCAKNTAYYLQFTIFLRGGGCFFCPNARKGELKNLYDNHPELWQRLVDMEKEKNLCSPYFRNITKEKICDIGEQFYWENAQMDIFDFIPEKE